MINPVRHYIKIGMPLQVETQRQKNLDIPPSVCYYTVLLDNDQTRRFAPCHTHHQPVNPYARLKAEIYVFLSGLFLLSLLFRRAMVG